MTRQTLNQAVKHAAGTQTTFSSGFSLIVLGTVRKPVNDDAWNDPPFFDRRLRDDWNDSRFDYRLVA
jgi:hypothetical protein